MSTLSVDTIQGKTTAGTVAMPAGMVVQTAYSSTTTKIHSSTSQADVTLMTADAFTPKFSSSHIHIILNMHFGYYNPNGGLQVVRAISGGATTFGIGDVPDTFNGGNGFWTADEFVLASASDDFYTIAQMGGYVVDTNHSTTNAITYSLRATSIGSINFNRAQTAPENGNARSSITLMEIKQ